jgi:hypothetical protein
LAPIERRKLTSITDGSSRSRSSKARVYNGSSCKEFSCGPPRTDGQTRRCRDSKSTCFFRYPNGQVLCNG